MARGVVVQLFGFLRYDTPFNVEDYSCFRFQANRSAIIPNGSSSRPPPIAVGFTASRPSQCIRTLVNGGIWSAAHWESREGSII